MTTQSIVVVPAPPAREGTSSTPSAFLSRWARTVTADRHDLLPPPVSLTASRVASSTRYLRKHPARMARLCLGAAVAVLGVTAAWWALDLAMWTAMKEFRDDCRDERAANLTVSAECDDALARSLRRPPVWRDYLRFPGETPYRAFRETRPTAVDHDELDDSSATSRSEAASRTVLPSGSYVPHYERFVHDAIEDAECDVICDGLGMSNSVRHQRDAAIMYGPIVRPAPEWGMPELVFWESSGEDMGAHNMEYHGTFEDKFAEDLWEDADGNWVPIVQVANRTREGSWESVTLSVYRPPPQVKWRRRGCWCDGHFVHLGGVLGGQELSWLGRLQRWELVSGPIGQTLLWAAFTLAVILFYGFTGGSEGRRRWREQQARGSTSGARDKTE